MRFTKMHGIGNDYVYIDAAASIPANPAALARQISDRHFGVGSDGLILICPSSVADVRMRMFNADGSESEMCGNGVRCVAKYAFDHNLAKSNPMKVETGNGVLTLSLELSAGKVKSVTVDMGEPILDLPSIPVDGSKATPADQPHEYLLQLPEAKMNFDATFVSMGNPHAVIFVNDADSIDLPRLGPMLEHHPAFPRRVNVHFVELLGPAEVKMRTWERGSGITLACGTGACAVAVAAALTKRTGREIIAHLPGGDLRLNWRADDNHITMTGPATEVFSGDYICE